MRKTRITALITLFVASMALTGCLSEGEEELGKASEKIGSYEFKCPVEVCEHYQVLAVMSKGERKLKLKPYGEKTYLGEDQTITFNSEDAPEISGMDLVKEEIYVYKDEEGKFVFANVDDLGLN